MPFATLNDAEEKELWRLSESPFFTPSFIYVIQSPVKTTKSRLISLTRRNDSKMYSSLFRLALMAANAGALEGVLTGHHVVLGSFNGSIMVLIEADKTQRLKLVAWLSFLLESQG